MQAALIALTVTAAFATAAPDQKHTDCLRSVATALEVSGEAASDVASATINACIPAEAYSKLGSVGASMTSQDRQEITRALRQAFEVWTLERVVRLRACRKTKGCEISTLPW